MLAGDPPCGDAHPKPETPIASQSLQGIRERRDHSCGRVYGHFRPQSLVTISPTPWWSRATIGSPCEIASRTTAPCVLDARKEEHVAGVVDVVHRAVRDSAPQVDGGIDRKGAHRAS